MLNGTLTLWDVRDVEKHCRKALDDTLRAMRATLREADYEDALAYLVAVAWRISGVDSGGRLIEPRPRGAYDPSRGWSFSKWCYRVCRQRVVDWYRQRFWDTRSPKPELPLSLDIPAENDDTDGLLDSLGSTLGARTGDPANDGSPDLDGILADRTRSVAWLLEPDGAAAARRAA